MLEWDRTERLVGLFRKSSTAPDADISTSKVLAAKFGWSYPHFMVVDGNDDRGIDVGVASMFQIDTVRSHVHDGRDTRDATFARDCPEYDLLVRDGGPLVVMPNHFKSNRNGDDEASRRRRTKQAKRADARALDAIARTDLELIADEGGLGRRSYSHRLRAQRMYVRTGSRDSAR